MPSIDFLSVFICIYFLCVCVFVCWRTLNWFNQNASRNSQALYLVSIIADFTYLLCVACVNMYLFCFIEFREILHNWSRRHIGIPVIYRRTMPIACLGQAHRCIQQLYLSVEYYYALHDTDSTYSYTWLPLATRPNKQTMRAMRPAIDRSIDCIV